MIQRFLARRRCLEILGTPQISAHGNLKKIFHVLWPNSWRLGVLLASGYFTVNANTAICLHKFGLIENGQYGLSVQLMGIASGMAYVGVMTKWPLIAQFRARRESNKIQEILRPRIWLQAATFFILAGGVVLLGPALLHWIGSSKQILPTKWLIILAIGTFMDLQITMWGTLVTTENRLPLLWVSVTSNILSFVLSLSLIQFQALGIGALVLGPMLAGCIFNYWYWPPFAARGIGTTLFRFLFFGPSKQTQSA
jgi:hypothetical protein